MKKTYGWVGSLAIHLLVVFLLLVPGVVKKPPAKAKPQAVKLVREDRLRGETKVGEGLSCAGYHYNGIGVRVAYDIIIDVGPNTPADKAGLQVNDELMDPNQVGPDRFPVGTVVQLKVKRQGAEMTIPISIDRICNE